MNPEEHILKSWHANATPWTNAVRSNAIESRKLVTNNAIIQALLDQQPKTMLDAGCGEGWLCRAMEDRGVAVTGVDAIPDLIAACKTMGRGEYFVCSYEEIADGKLNTGNTFDIVVFNFALFGNELVERMLLNLHPVFASGGRLIIQTLHPHTANADFPYEDGWRQGSWTGFADDFTDPAPWYFRTIEGWVNMLSRCGYQLLELREPVNPKTHKPASAIFICKSNI